MPSFTSFPYWVSRSKSTSLATSTCSLHHHQPIGLPHTYRSLFFSWKFQKSQLVVQYLLYNYKKHDNTCSANKKSSPIQFSLCGNVHTSRQYSIMKTGSFWYRVHTLFTFAAKPQWLITIIDVFRTFKPFFILSNVLCWWPWFLNSWNSLSSRHRAISLYQLNRDRILELIKQR